MQFLYGFAEGLSFYAKNARIFRKTVERMNNYSKNTPKNSKVFCKASKSTQGALRSLRAVVLCQYSLSLPLSAVAFDLRNKTAVLVSGDKEIRRLKQGVCGHILGKRKRAGKARAQSHTSLAP